MREYVEERNTGLFVIGTRVALESVIHEFKNGASPETILRAYPALKTLENVYGAITYYLANESKVEDYLGATERLWNSVRFLSRTKHGPLERATTGSAS